MKISFPLYDRREQFRRAAYIFESIEREVWEEVGLELKEDIEYLNDYVFTRPNGNITLGITFLVTGVLREIELAGKKFNQ